MLWLKDPDGCCSCVTVLVVPDLLRKKAHGMVSPYKNNHFMLSTCDACEEERLSG